MHVNSIKSLATRSAVYTLAVVLALTNLCSCSHKEPEEEQETTATTSAAKIVMPEDPKDRYFLSKEISLDADGYIMGAGNIIDTGNGKIARSYMCEEGEDEPVYHYRLIKYVDGTDEWNTYVDLQNSGVFLSDSCPLGDDRIVFSTYYGFDIYDINTGALVEKKDDLFQLKAGDQPAFLYRRGDDLVAVLRDSIYLIGNDFSVKSKIPITDEACFPGCNAFFSRGDHDYLVYEIDYSTVMQYFEVDFDSKTLTPCCSSGDLGISEEEAEVFGAGGYAFDKEAGIIYELDPGNGTKREIAYTGNMLVKPSTMQGVEPHWYIFGENDYMVQFNYGRGSADCAFMVPDTESVLAKRTRISVRGYSAKDDLILGHAVYKYNTSQDQYLMTIENYDDEHYGFNDPVKAQESKLKLLKEFSSGNAPDIFFGDNFDYDQMGRSGLVMDLSDLLKDSKSINKDTILPNIYNLYVEDGHCYKLFPGFTMNGYWSSSEFTGDNDNMTIDDLTSSTYSKRIFDDEYSTALADRSIRYPIKKLIDNGEFISEDELEKIIGFALDNGIGQHSPVNLTAYDMSYVDSKEVSLCYRPVAFVNTFMSEQSRMKDEMRFVGFPTINGSAHVAIPDGLVALSADTKYPEECRKFIEILFSDEIQKIGLISNIIPANKAIFDEALEITLDKSKIGDDRYYKIIFNGDEYNRDEGGEAIHYTRAGIESYRRAVESVDTMDIMDWGLYNIINEEINSRYQQKEIKDIAHSMRSRIVLYIEENYK